MVKVKGQSKYVHDTLVSTAVYYVYSLMVVVVGFHVMSSAAS